MKTILISILISLQLMAFTQITFENTYNGSAGYSQINDTEFRYYNFDPINKQCIIYDADHQQLLTIDIDLTDFQTLNSILYVSQKLFDLNDQLELLYIYSEWYQVDEVWYLEYNSRIIDQNGSSLQELPLAQYNTVHKTNEGSKLLSWTYDFSISSYPKETKVYHLPGTYTNLQENEHNEEIAAWPNPCAQHIYLPISEQVDIIRIINEQGQVIDELKSTSNDSQIKYDVNHLSAGLYFYQTILNNKENPVKKFIIQ